LKEAAILLGLNYSTAKSNIRIFRKENRIEKKNAEVEKALKKILIEKYSKQEHSTISQEMEVKSESQVPVSRFREVENLSNSTKVDAIAVTPPYSYEPDKFAEVDSLFSTFLQAVEDCNDLGLIKKNFIFSNFFGSWSSFLNKQALQVENYSFLLSHMKQDLERIFKLCFKNEVKIFLTTFFTQSNAILLDFPKLSERKTQSILQL
jgi:hypothetical protein